MHEQLYRTLLRKDAQEQRRRLKPGKDTPK
jgi:hypothetical protein